jgi:hypothetical protein
VFVLRHNSNWVESGINFWFSLFFPSLDFTTLSQKQSVFHQKGLIGVIKFVLNAHFVNLMFSPQAQDQWGRCSQLKFGAKEKDKTAKP